MSDYYLKMVKLAYSLDKTTRVCGYIHNYQSLDVGDYSCGR